MSTVSRVDLLQLLQDTPASLQAELADLLGFGVATPATNTLSFPVAELTKAAAETPASTGIKQIEWNPVFWYVDSYQARTTRPQKKATKSSRSSERADQPSSQALFSLAQQQALWDQCLNQQHQSKKPDIPLAVKLLAQVKPMTALTRLIRETQNQETVLFLDRSDALTPIWDDQLVLAESLQKLVGREHSQVLLMLNGISGAIRKLHRHKDENWSFDQLPGAARLVFISDLGVYSQQAQQQQTWENQLKQLKTLGHEVTVLTPVPLPARYDAICLDPKASQFAKLQQAIVGCLQAKLPRIRQLRLQVTGGCLADELTLWNHPHRIPQATGLNWCLAPENIHRWALTDPLTAQENRQLDKLHRRWRASMHKETEGMEQLIEEVIDPDKPADERLLDEALDRYANNPSQDSSAYQWLIAQKDVLKIMASHTAGKQKWHKINQSLQSALALTGQTLTEEPQSEITGPLYIKQVGADLVCTTDVERALLSSKQAIYDISTANCLKNGAILKGESANLRTLQADSQLKSITQPRWASRCWQEPEGIYAAHSENALFLRQAASAENPGAQWVCKHNPWSWAAATGVDDFGLWADLEVESAVYRLRWIHSAAFMMGSPLQEEGREDDETEHWVTLTSGFWMGETSCTQAFWQVVMGSNPSRFKDDRQLPVEMVSWEDCQRFLSRLLILHPTFSAQLPSEAQWEYACRAGTKTAYWWGEDLNEEYANNKHNTERESEYPANKFGLKSMSGNVLEWCADGYGAYTENDTVDPLGPITGRLRVLRGGSWLDDGCSLRSARRYACDSVKRRLNIGFRLAGGLDPQAGKQAFTAHRGPWSGQADGSKGWSDKTEEGQNEI